MRPLLFFLVVLTVMALAGMGVPEQGDFASFSGIPAGLGLLGVWVVVFLVNGFGEETGWRGYALPGLQTGSGRSRPRWSSRGCGPDGTPAVVLPAQL